MTCGQQLCSPQVSHAVSVGDEGQEPPPPPLLLPLLLLLPPPHGVAQLVVAHVSRLVNAVSGVVQVQPSPVHSSSHVTQVASLLHAVAWVQHWAARHMAQVEVAVIAGQDAPPPPEPLPELEQLPDEDPPPIPPPIPPPTPELQVLLPPLEDEHPTTASTARTAHARNQRMTRFIGNLPAGAAWPGRAPTTR
jgi:hypothetical protein